MFVCHTPATLTPPLACLLPTLSSLPVDSYLEDFRIYSKALRYVSPNSKKVTVM